MANRNNLNKIQSFSLFFLIGLICVTILAVIVGSNNNLAQKKITNSKAAENLSGWKCQVRGYPNPDCKGSPDQVDTFNNCFNNNLTTACSNTKDGHSFVTTCSYYNTCKSIDEKCVLNCNSVNKGCGSPGCQPYEIGLYYNSCNDPQFNYCVGKLYYCQATNECGSGGAGGSCSGENNPCIPNTQPGKPGSCCSGLDCGQAADKPKGTYVCATQASGPCAKNVCQNNMCRTVHVGYPGGQSNCNQVRDNCQTNADCLGGGPNYTGNSCECLQCNKCNTSANPKVCQIDWNCVNSDPTCKAKINQSCGGGDKKYLEDTASPYQALYTNPGDQMVFTGNKTYSSANWQFQWMTTPKGCTARYIYYSMQNGNWTVVGSQDVDYQYCKSSACTFTTSLASGSDRILIKLNNYTNDQTQCTGRIYSVKLRY